VIAHSQRLSCIGADKDTRCIPGAQSKLVSRHPQTDGRRPGLGVTQDFPQIPLVLQILLEEETHAAQKYQEEEEQTIHGVSGGQEGHC
jgi:hypothetical protein